MPDSIFCWERFVAPSVVVRWGCPLSERSGFKGQAGVLHNMQGTIFFKDGFRLAGWLGWMGLLILMQQVSSAARLDVQVTRTTDRRPVELVEVSLDLSPADGPPELTTLTDPFGFIKFKDVPAGTYSLKAQRAGFVTHEETVVFGPTDSRRANIQLVPVSAEVTFEIFFRFGGWPPMPTFPVPQWKSATGNRTGTSQARPMFFSRGSLMPWAW